MSGLASKKQSMTLSKKSPSNLNTRSNKSPSKGSEKSGTKSGAAGKFGKQGSSYSVTKSNKSGKSGAKSKGVKNRSPQDTEEECDEPPMLRDDDAIQFRRRIVDYDLEALER